MRSWLKFISNNRGEIDLGGKETFTADEVKSLVEKQVDGLVQPKIDSIVQTRLAQQARQYEGYEDLKKFKEDHTKQQQIDDQKKLEDQGKYEESLKAINTKIDDLNKVVADKDNTIQSMTIGNALTNEIVNQGGYLEESLAMLKSSAKLTDGVVTISGKDANGLDQNFSVVDGVKAFFEKRPHLVKATVNNGGGNSGAGGGQEGGGGNQGEDLTTLNDLLTKQIYANDVKGAAETKAKIKKYSAEKGITLANSVAY